MLSRSRRRTGEATATLGDQVSPIGGFTEPEYAHVGLTEANAPETHDAVVTRMRFGETTRTTVPHFVTGHFQAPSPDSRKRGKVLRREE